MCLTFSLLLFRSSLQTSPNRFVAAQKKFLHNYPTIVADTELIIEVPGMEIPGAFTSLEEAHISYQYHVNQAILLGYDIRARPSLERLSEPRRYLDIFRRWHLALEAFLKNKGESVSTSAQQAAGALDLNLRYLALNMEVSTHADHPLLIISASGISGFQQNNSLAWDNYNSRFLELIVLARENVEQSIQLDRQQKSRRFSLDTNIVATLNNIAIQCRDPFIRREAVALMYKLPPHEGLWDSIYTARVCEKLMSIEEEGLGEVKCAGDVPEWARIYEVNIGFDVEGRAEKIGYRRMRSASDPNGSEGRESIEWWLEAL